MTTALFLLVVVVPHPDRPRAGTELSWPGNLVAALTCASLLLRRGHRVLVPALTTAVRRCRGAHWG